MKLIWKLSLPQILIVACFGCISYLVINASFTGMRDRYVYDVVDNRFKRISVDIESNAKAAAELAALFARIPDVADAYAMAFSGDIDDGYAPQSQEAREKLRVDLAPMLTSYKDVSGSAMQLHFHLPNGRSLVRLWRPKQTRVKGEWVDVSDDLSSFRPTVLEVNRTGKVVTGLELGSGGFAVRGLVPVRDAEGRQLGSVEMLHDFDDILANATTEGQNEMILYINADLLPVATALQDQDKNPRVGDFVRVTTPREASMTANVTPELLAAGKSRTIFEEYGDIALGTMPIKDYRGEQVGVLVCATKTGLLASLMRTADVTLASMLACMAVVPFLALLLVLRAFVTRPIRHIIGKIKDIAEDRADLNQKIDSRQNDEIGDLARAFDELTTKLGSILDKTAGYANMLNTVPDAIFMVEDEYRIVMANKATLRFLGKTEEELRLSNCGDLFGCKISSKDKCPIEMVKRTGAAVTSEIVEISARDGGRVFVKPSASVVRDSAGNKTGYIEVARDVTDLVESEQKINEKLDRIRSVNDATREAAAQLNTEAGTLDGRFAGVQEALARQHQRLQETVVAMDQMSATVHEVAKGASEAANQTQEARDQALCGADVVEKSIQAIARVSGHAEETKKTMGNLGRQAQEIGAVLNVISDIADQTNLLALNAAIEAARAGDAGRGFAVVADEVRKLAEKTMQATGEVDVAIRSIQTGTRDSVHIVDETGRMVEEASSLASQSGEALRRIVGLVAASADQVRGIAAAAEEQAATSEHINKAIEAISHMAMDVENSMNASSASARKLAGLAMRLDALSHG